jgi:mono/diheme cytochrome c family protein
MTAKSTAAVANHAFAAIVEENTDVIMRSCISRNRVLPASGSIKLGDAYRGQTVFFTTCAVCHGNAAQGGAGPKLKGAQISLAVAKAQIDNGGAAMPPKLVQGQREEDVLAYLATIFARS